MIRKTLLFILALASTHHANAQDAAKGERVFKRCIGCHAVGDKAVDGVGPQLNGILGTKVAGQSATYAYSQALKKSGEDGQVWTQELLEQWVLSPRKTIPGNKMTFTGLTGAEASADARDLVAYLRTLKR